MAGILITFIFLLLLNSTVNGDLQPSIDEEYMHKTDSDSYRINDKSITVTKRDLEFNQYVPAYRLSPSEPSCKTLRTMWLLSKRESRRATSTNQLPRARPYSFGHLMAFAPAPFSRQFVYGEPRNFASKGGLISPVKGSLNKLIGMIGVGASRPGSFSRLRGIVSNQRRPGQTSKGKYNELRDMVIDYHLDKSSPKEVVQASPSLGSSDIYQPVRRSIHYKMSDQSSQNQDVQLLRAFIHGKPISKKLQLSTWNFQKK